MIELQTLLNQVSIITQKNAEIRETYGNRFNLFQIFGVDHYENKHSAVLAELLKPDGSHGFKHKFVECFIKTLSLHKIIEFDYVNCIVNTEFQINNGRIDILIKDKAYKAIIIENKIYAGDQSEQLKRYSDFAKSEFGEGNYVLLYLSLTGAGASEQSSKSVNYVQVSYNIDIIDWLNKCVEIAARSPIVRESLIQYINHLKKLTNQDMDTKSKEEIVKLLTIPENIEAAFIISQNMTAVKEYVVYEHFNKALFEIAKELCLVAIPIKTNVIYSGFGFEVPNWKYFTIYFEFDGSNFMKLGYMLKLKNKETMCPAETVKELYPYFKRHNNNRLLPLGWTYWEKYQDWNIEAMKAILSGEMKTEIKGITQKLIGISEKFDL